MLKEKECEICCGFYTPNNASQRYCPECQKNPQRARAEIIRAQRRLDFAFGKAADRQMETCQCKQCQRTFQAKYIRDFCSQECRLTYNDAHIKCAYCGRLMAEVGKHYPNRRPGSEVFCSDDCREKNKWRKARKRGMVDTCPHCGKEFIVAIRKQDGGYVTMRQKYCSKECARAVDAEAKSCFEYVTAK